MGEALNYQSTAQHPIYTKVCAEGLLLLAGHACFISQLFQPPQAVRVLKPCYNPSPPFPLPERLSMADLSSVGFSDLDLESLRARLRKMNDQELRRFGLAARFMCSPDAYFGQSPRRTFVI